MQSGLLDQIIQLISHTTTNEGGEMIDIYTILDDIVFAQVISQKGKEAFEAARTNARNNVRVGMRYRDDLDTTWRFIWSGDTFNVTNVDRSMRRDGMLWVTGQAVGAI
jgi:SPP1 family predicted phage head-tail adaptor